ncbi:MAG: hypothetical protein KDC12_01525 [Flavobacteriales bacterium]|nr:hypothetical protein [Flavobacteriales bacterium]
MLRALYTFTVFFVVAMVSQAQQVDSVLTPSPVQEEPDFYVPPVKLKPRLGLGVGTFYYLGEVGRDNGGYNLGTAGAAWRLSVTNEVTSYLDVRFYSLFGSFEVNEYTNPRHLNFRTEMRTLGANVEYNFSNFIPTRTRIQPFITVGIEGFEFLSKTDLRDANGTMYCYWSDGTIRDLPEDHKDAEYANLLSRDYVYETDLRDLDLDGLGKYQDRSWAVPVGFGAQMLLTDRFKLRFGTEMHFTFTDLIDNVSDAGQGVRLGDSRNDRFLFTSATLTYDLNITPKPVPQNVPLRMMNDDGEWETIVINDDGDGDGVNDFIDKETNTPEGVEVDADGVALDSDGDGVPDYADAEPNTAPGAWVNSDGETISDETFEHKYLMWTDSIPWETTAWTEDYAKIESDPAHWSNSYSVKVSTGGEGLTQAEINLLLSYKDVKSFKQGDESVYLIGEYNNLPDAVQRQMDLEDQGIQGDVAKQVDTGYVDMTAEAAQIRQGMEANRAEPAEHSDDVTFRVQIGAFRYALSDNIFSDINDLVVVHGQDGLTRYMTGSYTDMSSAADRKIELLLAGFEGAFITAYRSGDRITLNDAGMNVVEGARDITYDEVNHSINTDRISFTILLGEFSEQLPTETLDAYLELGHVKPERNADGTTRYTFGTFNSVEEAERALEDVHARGMAGAQAQGFFEGKILSLEEAKRIIENDQVEQTD